MRWKSSPSDSANLDTDSSLMTQTDIAVHSVDPARDSTIA